ncbi:putative addiction module antidote [Anoxybacillus tepidamans]|uniref:Putative addiction module antidote n=1 Tax=Anoxybacteroides tepidamans TaxID=265948 RepID=A0A7W8IN16_9BACL|nr:AbrB/MazE/SpoVT family DNA-binding domain-containing protein [Anoxybacillus tepidamans]MBB5323493.1 putative addiction module antidote [Anoxybacillus tepidamans]
MLAEEKYYIRKISQVGNSLSVNIPAEFVKEMELRKGEEVILIYNQEKGEVTMRKSIKKLPEGIRPEVLHALNKAVTIYDQAFKNLKER